ncbi:CHAT domain-containing protein [Candidatus Pelagibacter sp.]|nr:CHAT domain-containing protein [Candidatus Pelagibacter sp.]
MPKITNIHFFTFFILINFSLFSLSIANENISIGITVGKSNSKEFSTSAIVKAVEDDSPAQKAGILKGDFISSINKTKIKSPIHYIKTIKSFNKNDKIQIELIRDKKYLTKEIILSVKKISETNTGIKKAYSVGFNGISGREKDLIRVNNYTQKILDKYKFSESNNETLIVTCIKKGSEAEKSGIKLYDEIIEVDGKSIKYLKDLNFSTKRSVKIKILRNSKILNIQTRSEHQTTLNKYDFNCVKEYKEYECSNIVLIDYDKRENNYFEVLLDCLTKKKIHTIPFGPITYEFNWIKVDTVKNIIYKYANKNTRDVEKLNNYLPLALEILDEFDLYLKNNDKDNTALLKYKELRKSVTYANRFAVVKGLKDSEISSMNDGTISGYKKAISFLINKNQPISGSDRGIFDEAFNALWEYGEKEFIFKNWPKAIKLIDWKSLAAHEIKIFRIFYHLGDLYSSEPNYEKAIQYYDMGLEKLDEWSKNLPLTRLQVVYKRRIHVKKSYQVILFATKKYNETFDNKYIKIMEKNIKESEGVISYFHSLPKKIKDEIRTRNPKHLFDIYNTMNSAYAFLGKRDKMYESARKGLDDLEKYSRGKDRNGDLFEAYHQVILASIGDNKLNDTVYYINQSKNLATQLVANDTGRVKVGNMISMVLPTIINSGLYAEAEDLINFINDFIEFDTYTAIGRMQEDILNYSSGKINLIKKNYKEAVYDFELASLNYKKKSGNDMYNLYSSFANLMLLEAYIENNDIGKFERHFEFLTGVKPLNYKSVNTDYDLIGSSVAQHTYVSADIDISMLAALLKYLDGKKIRISKKDSKEYLSYINDYFKDYIPGEESRLEMIRNSVKASSLLASNDYKESTKFLSKISKEVKKEYTSELYDSNLTPVHKIDDIIEGYLNASYVSKDEKFLSDSYKTIQVVSNSITAKDIKKSLKTKKFNDQETNKLIEQYQKLQIEKVSFVSKKEFDLSSVSESTYQELGEFDVTRSIEIDKELKNLEKKIKTKAPSYFKKIKPEGASLKEIQKNLNLNQALVEYFFFKDRFFVLLIKKDKFEIIKIDEKIKNLENSADALRKSININEDGGLNKFDTLEGFKLYEKLFLPIQSYLNSETEIIVIPNKFLKNVPLHLFPTNKADKCLDCSNVNWLMDKYDFVYVPNAEFFSLNKANNIFSKIKIKTNNDFFLGIGNPNLEIKKEINTKKIAKKIDKLSKIINRGSFIKETDEIKNIYGLVDGSQEELETIQSYLKPAKSKLLLWDDANEDKIKSLNLKNFKIIHFATHGELAGTIEGQNEPFLVLSPPNIGTKENDGILTMSEIMNLENNAELVILSACNTAGGNIKQSEGFSGLARAFLFSGSKSVLVSNWYVETFAAMELTTGMMKEIKNNSKITTSKALSLSMKNFIKNNDKKSHPFYWAPFVIVGLNSNINLN